MKRRKTNLKIEYRAALAYYKATIWKHIRDRRLSGAEYDMSLLAYLRLSDAQRACLDSLPPESPQRARIAEKIESLSPHREQRDDAINPELLAALASARLGMPKPKSVSTAIGES